MTFPIPNPQLDSHFVMVVPHFVITNRQLTSFSWSYHNPVSGAEIQPAPEFISELDCSIYGPEFGQNGPDDNEIFDQRLDPRGSGVPLDPPLPWGNLMVIFRYEDSLGNSYSLPYSFGNFYQVWGGPSLAALSSGDPYRDPEGCGFTLLGGATGTATFTGAYNVYLVRVPKHNVIKADTLRGSNGIYYATYYTGNTAEYPNIGGPPDGLYATVGQSPRGFDTGGIFAVDATDKGLTSVTVFTAP